MVDVAAQRSVRSMPTPKASQCRRPGRCHRTSAFGFTMPQPPTRASRGPPAACREPQVELARLSEQEVARAQARLGFRAEHGDGELVNRPWSGACRRQGLRTGGTPGMGVSSSVRNTARGRDVQRHARSGRHGLIECCVRTPCWSRRNQRRPWPDCPLDVEGVLHLAGRMVGPKFRSRSCTIRLRFPDRRRSASPWR